MKKLINDPRRLVRELLEGTVDLSPRLGGTPPMELAVVAREALAGLRPQGMAVERAWCGNFMTAIEMPGCSLTLLPLDEQRNSLLDDAADVAVWPGDGRIAERLRRLRNLSLPRPAPDRCRRS